MRVTMTILSQGYNEFYNKCHGEEGKFCSGSGHDDQWSTYSERGRRRASDLKAGKEYKSLPKAKFDNELDSADAWPEKWIGEKERKTGKFAVPLFLKGKRGLDSPVSYDQAVRNRNLLEITRKGKDGKKEYLSPDTNHLTARMKAIGLDKVISPKELSRIVREDKPVWVDNTSVNNWRFYKIPKLHEEVGVGLTKNGTIGTVIPGGYLPMAIDELGKDSNARSQLGRLLMRNRVAQQVPSDETVTPTVPISPIKIGTTVFRRP